MWGDVTGSTPPRVGANEVYVGTGGQNLMAKTLLWPGHVLRPTLLSFVIE